MSPLDLLHLHTMHDNPVLIVGKFSDVSAAQVAELNAKVQELEKQYNAAVDDKEAAIRESERCQLKLQLANRLINALASEGGRLTTDEGLQ